MRHLFNVNNKDTRMTLLTLFWCFYCQFWTYFTHYSCISIVDFVKVNAGIVIPMMWILILFLPRDSKGLSQMRNVKLFINAKSCGILLLYVWFSTEHFLITGEQCMNRKSVLNGNFDENFLLLNWCNSEIAAWVKFGVQITQEYAKSSVLYSNCTCALFVFTINNLQKM